VREVSEFAPSPHAQPVAAAVWPAMDSRPAAYHRPPAQLRFSIHAIDEVASAPAAVQSPKPAGPRPGLQPIAVESMPAVRAFSVAELPLTPPLTLPSIRSMTA